MQRREVTHRPSRNGDRVSLWPSHPAWASGAGATALLGLTVHHPGSVVTGGPKFAVRSQ